MAIGPNQRTLALLWVLWSTPQAYGFVADDDHENALFLEQSLGLRSSREDDHITVKAALQLRPKTPQGLPLHDLEILLGETGVTAERVLRELTPHLVKLVPELIQRKVRGTVIHEVYQLKYGSWVVAHSLIELHHYSQKLVLLRVSLPRIERLDHKPSPSEFKSPAELLPESWKDAMGQMEAYQILAAVNGELTPAWEVRGFDSQRGAVVHQVIDARYGTLLDEKSAEFKLTSVYSKNPKDGRLIDVTLPDLTTPSSLDGKYFSIFSPDNSSPRASGENGDFSYRPDLGNDTVHFDEVQTYYHASQALRFFRDKFGFNAGPNELKIRVHHGMNGKPDNAYYVPDPTFPEIRIGRGEKLKNLARDVDVISHEFAHHVIYGYLKEAKGESGVLHEGTADYFAYAISDDPFLGESVSPTSDYIRTAKSNDKDRYDVLPPTAKAHIRGSYWSSVLWTIRENLGSQYADLLVYESLPYLGHSGTIKDGFLGLLSADRDLSAKSNDGDIPLYGENKCVILEAGIKLGFASFLEEFDGSSCGLDLANLAKVSREQKNSQAKSEQNEKPIKIPLKACGTIDSVGGRDNGEPGFVALILILPAVITLLTTRRSIFWISIKS